MFVAFDAQGPSLPGVFRSLNLDPECQEALVRLAEEVRRLTEQRDHEAEFEAMVTRAKGLPLAPPLPPPPKRKPRTPPEKRWLRAVPAFVAGSAANWLLRSQWHRRLATGALIAAVGTGAALSPDLMAPAPAAQVPHARHTARHHHGGAPGVVPVAPDRRKRRRRPAAAASSAPPRPSRSASPAPSPLATDPDPVPTVTPVPLPSPTLPLPVPLPSPSCLPLHGHHCHPGDVLEPLEEVTGGALRGLTGLS